MDEKKEKIYLKRIMKKHKELLDTTNYGAVDIYEILREYFSLDKDRQLDLKTEE